MLPLSSSRRTKLQAKIELVVFLTVERKGSRTGGEQVVWAAREAAAVGMVQVQEHAALPALCTGRADDPDSSCPLLTLVSLFFLPAKPGDTYEDQTI